MKSYSGRKVVKDVSLEVNQGEIVGLLGPNIHTFDKLKEICQKNFNCSIHECRKKTNI